MSDHYIFFKFYQWDIYITDIVMKIATILTIVNSANIYSIVLKCNKTFIILCVCFKISS